VSRFPGDRRVVAGPEGGRRPPAGPALILPRRHLRRSRKGRSGPSRPVVDRTRLVVRSQGDAMLALAELLASEGTPYPPPGGGPRGGRRLRLAAKCC
jgi:hypothetical protein